MNRNDRNLLAENLRHYLSGAITNFELMDSIAPVYRTNDKGVKAVEEAFWYCYSDLKEHKNTGKHKLNEESVNHIKRMILFLKSSNEYEWKNPKFPNPIHWIFHLLTFRIYAKKKENNEADNTEAGDEHVWPFFREIELKNELVNPKYLNSKTIHS